MNKKEKRIALRQNVEKAVVRDEQNRRIQDAATNSAQNVLRQMNAALRGLDAETVLEHHNQYGSNKVTREKKKSLAKRLAGAFINPSTAILFCLALVSIMTDMVFPYKNLMDLAIIHKTEEAEAEDPRLLDLSEHYVKVDEIPFDFTRRRLTTVVQDQAGKTQMVTKGAVEEMLSICAFAECDGSVQPLTDEVRGRILQTVEGLNEKGFRVLAIAQKSNPSPVGAFGVKDEQDMVLMGYLIPCILLYMVLATSLKKAYVRHYGELL